MFAQFFQYLFAFFVYFMNKQDRDDEEQRNELDGLMRQLSNSERIRSMSEVYSWESPCYMLESPLTKVPSVNISHSRCMSPVIPSMDPSSMKSEGIHMDSETIIGSSYTSNTHLAPISHDTRGRRFSELSISDMPSECVHGRIRNLVLGLEPLPTLNISFPCSYEENLESRGKSIVQLREAAIKRVIIRNGPKLSRFNIVYTKDRFYWPQETIRHCRTGRIKRGQILKRQFGIYYPEKSRDLIALKIMEKVGANTAETLYNA